MCSRRSPSPSGAPSRTARGGPTAGQSKRLASAASNGPGLQPRLQAVAGLPGEDAVLSLDTSRWGPSRYALHEELKADHLVAIETIRTTEVEALGRAEIELPPVAESTNKGHVFHAAPALAAGSGAREATAEFVHVTVVAVVEIVDVLTEPEAAAFAAEWSFGPYGFVLARSAASDAGAGRSTRAVPCVGRPASPVARALRSTERTSNTTSDSEPLLSLARPRAVISRKAALRRDLPQI